MNESKQRAVAIDGLEYISTLVRRYAEIERIYLQGEGLTLRGDLEAAKLLVENGADLNIHMEDGNTPLHEAIEMVTSDEVPDNHVLEELQPGYRIKERLLRPAMVRVAKRSN